MGRQRFSQLGWFIALWFAGVATISIVGLVIKLWLKA